LLYLLDADNSLPWHTAPAATSFPLRKVAGRPAIEHAAGIITVRESFSGSRRVDTRQVGGDLARWRLPWSRSALEGNVVIDDLL